MEDKKMKLAELLKALLEHNKTTQGYQIHLNSNNLDDKSSKQTGIEFGDLYFSDCNTLGNSMLISFGNMSRKPTGQTEDGTDIYPLETNSNMFIDINKIETIEDVQDFEDWFELPSDRVINVYMYPENDNMNGNRNVITIGFLA